MKEKVVAEDQGGKHNLILYRDRYLRYIALSKYLFASGEDAIYDINEIPKESDFHKPAKSIAKSLGVNWKKMTHEESNRIMLALLEDFYNAMSEVGDKDKMEVEIKLKIVK